ncbi:J domain-containing protein [Anaerostipes sp. NSJ-7]|uniref:J domain-containing protein n=1 Tax=Anaerostipes hominis (ex Liu et al. 2021) TaxID=2763018 RepID=A0ABR7FV18_9FIRM|nr:J domain-containing protein [Anaerostipes hominis (ex Liu et al. 2021)]MBC5678663.1 J domain-containing protein [Anaerostipes hominis (ex Liu et al. 2021)]
MYKYFAGVKTIEELRQKYRELLKKYHPDNEGGSVEITQEINAEYDSLFVILSEEKSANEETPKYDYQAENDAFKEILNKIIHINADIEIIGSWIWVHGGYEYKELLKSVGFKYASKKKCWCWHYGDYVRYHDKEITLDEIRQKYGSKKVGSKSRQYAIS